MEYAVGAVAGAMNNLTEDDRRPSRRWSNTGKRRALGNGIGGERRLAGCAAGSLAVGAILARFAAVSGPGSASSARPAARATARYHGAFSMQAMTSAVGRLGRMRPVGISARKPAPGCRVRLLPFPFTQSAAAPHPTRVLSRCTC